MLACERRAQKATGQIKDQKPKTGTQAFNLKKRRGKKRLPNTTKYYNTLCTRLSSFRSTATSPSVSLIHKMHNVDRHTVSMSVHDEAKNAPLKNARPLEVVVLDPSSAVRNILAAGLNANLRFGGDGFSLLEAAALGGDWRS